MHSLSNMNRPANIMGLRPPGFTAAEVVIVLVIIAIITAIAVPRYANALANRRVNLAAARITADLALARSRAKSSGTSQTVTFDTATDTYELLGMSHPDHPGHSYRVLLSSEPYQASIAAVDFDGTDKIVFDGYGVPTAGGSVVVTVGQYGKTITVDADTAKATVVDK